MQRAFRWNDWNLNHIAEHGISAKEAEFLIEGALPPYPRVMGGGKHIVIGRLPDGSYGQVIFVYDDDQTAYVIHARPLTDLEKRRYRRTKR